MLIIKNIRTADTCCHNLCLCVLQIHGLLISPDHFRTADCHVRQIAVIWIFLQRLSVVTKNKLCRTHAEFLKCTAGMPQLINFCSFTQRNTTGHIACVIQEYIMSIGNVFKHSQTPLNISPLSRFNILNKLLMNIKTIRLHAIIDKPETVCYLIKTNFHKNCFFPFNLLPFNVVFVSQRKYNTKHQYLTDLFPGLPVKFFYAIWQNIINLLQ